MNYRILLADDDDDDHLIFTEAINEVEPGIYCQIAQNGEKLLSILNEQYPLPDLIFIDINMPLLNGFECLAAIKSRREFAAIPVVIFSTAANKSAIETARLLGAQLFLSKPSDHKELTKKLAKTLDLLLPKSSKNRQQSPAEFYI